MSFWSWDKLLCLPRICSRVCVCICAGYHTDSAGLIKVFRPEAFQPHRHHHQPGFKRVGAFRQTRSLPWASFGNWINPRGETDS